MTDSKRDTVLNPTRRDLLGRVLGLWVLLTGAPIIGMILQFITPLKSKEIERESLRVASVDDIGRNTAKIFKFNKDPVIVVHTESGQFKAFNARCTHLGCIVQYKNEGVPHFACNCHGSEFNINGNNVAGPAPSPLTPFKVTLQQSSIIVSKT